MTFSLVKRNAVFVTGKLIITEPLQIESKPVTTSSGTILKSWQMEDLIYTAK